MNDDSRVEEVVTFDHEFGSEGIMRENYFCNEYINFIGDDKDKNRFQFAKAIKNNETVHSVVSVSSLAEKVGSAPIDETVRDIKDEIGYNVGQTYIDDLKHSYERLAEDLIMN